MTTVVCDWVYVTTIERHCVRMCDQVCLIRDVCTGRWCTISLQSSCWFCNVQTSNTYTSVCTQFPNVLHNRTQCRSPIRIWYATWCVVRTSLPVFLPLSKVVILSYLYRIPAFHNYIHDWKPSIRNYYEIRYIVHYYVHKCIYYRNSVWSIRQVSMLRSVVVMIIVNFTTWRPLKLYTATCISRACLLADIRSRLCHFVTTKCTYFCLCNGWPFLVSNRFRLNVLLNIILLHWKVLEECF